MTLRPNRCGRSASAPNISRRFSGKLCGRLQTGNKGRMIRHSISQIEATEPTICQIQVHFLAQSPFRPDTKAVAHKQHADQQLGIDGRATCMAIKVRQMTADTAQLNKSTAAGDLGERGPLTRTHRTVRPELPVLIPSSTSLPFNRRIESVGWPLIKADLFNRIWPSCQRCLVLGCPLFTKSNFDVGSLWAHSTKSGLSQRRACTSPNLRVIAAQPTSALQFWFPVHPHVA